jgi:DNA adenine methylase
MDRQVPHTTESERAIVRPFLKWTGGKRWLTSTIRLRLPSHFNRYIEPFLGGGALFFYLRAWPASLSDSNEELINAYKQVRDNVEAVIVGLSRREISHAAYDSMRSSTPSKEVARAVRFLYLNRTAFNGVYRVNQKGHFNVPYGCKPGTVLCDKTLLRAASEALQRRRLMICDFEEAIDRAERGDLVYADPPYTTKHNNNGFRRYNDVIFSWQDQERLADSLHRASRRGAHVILSNAHHQPLIELYAGFSVASVTRPSLLSADLKGRGQIDECLIYKCHAR